MVSIPYQRWAGDAKNLITAELRAQDPSVVRSGWASYHPNVRGRSEAPRATSKTSRRSVRQDARRS